MNIRHLGAVVALIAVLGILAACSSGDSESDPASTTPAATQAGKTPASTASPGEAIADYAVPDGRPPDTDLLDLPSAGDAGIPSDPHSIPGLEKFLELDDGLAAWEERPAGEDRTGVTDRTIKFGRTTGMTGMTSFLESTIDPTIRALFEAINNAGGIHGRKLELITKDDKYDPSLTASVERELVENDEVFGMFLSLGEPTLATIQEYEVEHNVLSFANTGAVVYPMPPLHTRLNAPAQTSGMAIVKALMQLDPDFTASLVIHDEAWGRSYGDGVKIGAEQLGVEDKIKNYIYVELNAADLAPVAQQIGEQGPHHYIITGGLETFDISVVKALRESVGYKGNVILGNVPTDRWGDLADGVYTLFQDQDNCMVFDTTPVCTQIKAFLDSKDIPWMQSYTPLALIPVEILVRVLEIAGPDLTREGFQEAAYIAMDGHWICNLCSETAPYIVTPNDYFIMETVAHLGRWNAQTKQPELVEGVDPINTEESFGLGAIGPAEQWPCQPASGDRPLGTCPWKYTEWDKSGSP